MTLYVKISRLNINFFSIIYGKIKLSDINQPKLSDLLLKNSCVATIGNKALNSLSLFIILLDW